MSRRRQIDIDAIDASEGSRFSLIADSLWTAQDRARAGIGRAAEWISWTLGERVVWPVRDRAETLDGPLRGVALGALVVLAAGVGVAGLLWAAPDGHSGTTVAQTASSTSPPVAGSSDPPKAAPAPTLHGAAPVFEVAGGSGPSKAAAAVAPSGSASKPAGAPQSAGSETISSSPKPSTATASSAKEAPIRGPLAGPEAIAVARDFAAAFVTYEVGEAEDPSVRKAFSATATPALTHALMRRPPRLPAHVKVPKARVLNVVPAPSHEHVYPVSVSLLRVGTTSELRLELEKSKGKRWRVTNVLG